MNHCGTKRPETDRLVLRQYMVGDAQAMYENWASDEKVTEFLLWKPHSDPRETVKFLEDWTPRYSEEDYYNWAIVLKENGDNPIGNIWVGRIKEKAVSAEVGYCVGREFWHKGIASEALKAVMDFLFDEVGVNRIEAYHDPRNPYSGDVMKKCGMKYEGTLRASEWNNLGICDAYWYSMLKSER